MSYADYVSSRESPDGRDNAAGSGAFSKYQFMPATAVGLAQRTPWGAGATPANVKSLVMADPARADELFKLYNASSTSALAGAGLPNNNTNMLALHRFGQGGGVSLLNTPGQTPVAQWVNSVNWGPGVAADAVMRQNGLDRYANVGDLRKRFLGSDEPASPVAGMYADAPAPPAAAPKPFQGTATPPVAGIPSVGVSSVADLFQEPAQPIDPNAERRKRLAAAFNTSS